MSSPLEDLEAPLLGGTGNVQGVLDAVGSWWTLTHDPDWAWERTRRSAAFYVLVVQTLVDLLTFFFFVNCEAVLGITRQQQGVACCVDLAVLFALGLLQKFISPMKRDWIITCIVVAFGLHNQLVFTNGGTLFMVNQSILMAFDPHSSCILFYFAVTSVSMCVVETTAALPVLYTVAYGVALNTIVYAWREYQYANERQQRLKTHEELITAERRERAALLDAAALKQQEQERLLKDREKLVSQALQELKTPLLLAKSDMAGITKSNKGEVLHAVTCRINQLWQALSGLEVQVQSLLQKMPLADGKPHMQSLQRDPATEEPKEPKGPKGSQEPKGREGHNHLHRTRAPRAERQQPLWDVSKLEHIDIEFEVSQRFHMHEVILRFFDAKDCNHACDVLDLIPSQDRAAFKSWVQDSANGLENGETNLVKGDPLRAFIPGTGAFFKANAVSALDAGYPEAEGEDILRLRIRLSELVPPAPKPKTPKSSSGRLQTGFMLECIGEDSTSQTS